VLSDGPPEHAAGAPPRAADGRMGGARQQVLQAHAQRPHVGGRTVTRLATARLLQRETELVRGCAIFSTSETSSLGPARRRVPALHNLDGSLRRRAA